MWHMKQNYRIYIKDAFEDIVKLYGTATEFAKFIGTDKQTLNNALRKKPVQAKFVANTLKKVGCPFESLFEVR